jgi:hypothetical protein
MSTTRDDLSRALCDVRRSYRLLQVYQRRLCDLLQLVDGVLAAAGLEFDRWYPINVARPPRARKPFWSGTWAWDFTPIYQVRCSWEQATKGRARRVDIDCIADTAYVTNSEGEPDPSTFKDADQSATELHVGLWTARAKRADWNNAWAQVSQLPDWDDGGAHAVLVDGVEHTCRVFRVDIADLVDPEAVRAKLLDPIEQWLAEPLNPVSEATRP